MKEIPEDDMEYLLDDNIEDKEDPTNPHHPVSNEQPNLGFVTYFHKILKLLSIQNSLYVLTS